MGLFSRLRHSRGFGIHSPFAYRFLTEVLRDSGMYYGHECLGRRERLLGRLRAFVDPMQLAPLAGVRPVEVVILGPASAFDAELPENTLYYADTRDEAIEVLDARLDALGFGITFRSQSGASVIVPFRRLPRQVIETRF